jgi:hypothetical protein
MKVQTRFRVPTRELRDLVVLTAGGFVLMLFLAPCSVHHTAEVANTVVKSDSRALGAGFKFNVQLVGCSLRVRKDEGDSSDSFYRLTAKETQLVRSM